ncbi:hypothetical protein FG384_06525 [Psychrobacillus vulpis]|uniref:Uncharacterized protein n=1 Tax=Psychrobacillus vulpis TaxID=2325572 RepID=A0A544TTE6_9BACI|nr:hypothetical protein FG384_06525 [Psychrobacillus vulpis]
MIGTEAATPAGTACPGETPQELATRRLKGRPRKASAEVKINGIFSQYHKKACYQTHIFVFTYSLKPPKLMGGFLVKEHIQIHI